MTEPNYVDQLRDISNIKKKQKYLQELQKKVEDKEIAFIKLRNRLILLRAYMEVDELER